MICQGWKPPRTGNEWAALRPAGAFSATLWDELSIILCLLGEDNGLPSTRAPSSLSPACPTPSTAITTYRFRTNRTVVHCDPPPPVASRYRGLVIGSSQALTVPHCAALPCSDLVDPDIPACKPIIIDEQPTWSRRPSPTSLGRRCFSPRLSACMKSCSRFELSPFGCPFWCLVPS